jgi:excisionase family DNA binding protein
MNHRPTQFDMRENISSSRQHAPRFAADSHSNAICIEEESQETSGPSPLNDDPVGSSQSPLHAASQHAATGENGEETAASFAVIVANASPAKTAAPPTDFEPLLDVAEAAALLRMHPRTLRTKARNQTIPAIHVGRRWRFRASTLNDWLGKLAS